MAATRSTNQDNGTTRMQSLAERVYASMKRDIRRCELEPGRQVTEAELVRRYDAGRDTVRSALSRLISDRLIEVMPREGYVVAPITIKNIYDLFDARLVLEPSLARLAAGRLSVELRERLDQLGQVHYRVDDPSSLDAFLEANTSFHLGIAEAVGNAYLYGMLAILLEQKERVSHLSKMLRDQNAEITNQHAEIIDALETGDGERAASLMVTHVESDREDVLRAILMNPVLQSVNLGTG